MNIAKTQHNEKSKDVLTVMRLRIAASTGLEYLEYCNVNSFRSKLILGFSLFMGLSVPQYFKEYVFLSGYGPVHTGSTWVREYEMQLISLNGVDFYSSLNKFRFII